MVDAELQILSYRSLLSINCVPKYTGISLCWKTQLSPAKVGVLGNFDPHTSCHINDAPKRHILGSNCVLCALSVTLRCPVRPERPPEKPEKNEEAHANIISHE
jgi:hypothetical protein